MSDNEKVYKNYEIEVYKSHWVCVRPSLFADCHRITSRSIDHAFEAAKEYITGWEHQSNTAMARCINLREVPSEEWYNIFNECEWYHPAEKRERIIPER